MHVSSVSSVFKRMLQVLYLDVSKVNRASPCLASVSPPPNASWVSKPKTQAGAASPSSWCYWRSGQHGPACGARNKLQMRASRLGASTVVPPLTIHSCFSGYRGIAPLGLAWNADRPWALDSDPHRTPVAAASVHGAQASDSIAKSPTTSGQNGQADLLRLGGPA
jgi:hypothetical protein